MADNVTLLAGVARPDNTPWAPFSPTVLEFLSEAAGEIRRDPALSGDTEAISFAFWCRRAHLAAMAQPYAGAARLGRGLLFHVPPSNIPLLFAYSLAVGMLAGCANVVRLSSRHDARGDALCAVFDRVLHRPAYAGLLARTAILAYPREDEAVTAQWMARCQGRVVWGGDATVLAMRRFPMAPGAVSLEFPDRWSLCLLRQSHIAGLSDDQLAELAHRFYNDTYLMDQNACSSPKLVLWLADGGPTAGRRWWQAVRARAEASYDLTAFKAARKYEGLCVLGMTEPAIDRLERSGNLLCRAALSGPPSEPDRLKAAFGTFLEAQIEDLSQLAPYVTARTQTLTYAGFDHDDLASLVSELQLPGIDRIVPVGQAMEFDLIWDGKDQIAQLSRVIC